MLSVAIVEDSEPDAEILKNHLHRYETEQDVRFQIARFRDGDEIAVKYRGGYDLLLLDIEMQFMDGMKAAEEIRKVDPEVIIVFVTNAPQYAIRGYAVDAFDYILKPVEYMAFSRRLDLVCQRLEKRQARYLSISSQSGMSKVSTSDIYYIEISNHSLLFHTKKGLIRSTGSLRDLEEKLEPSGFFRSSKGYLVNLEYVDRVEGEDAIVHGDRVQVSRAKHKGFLNALNHYLGEVM